MQWVSHKQASCRIIVRNYSPEACPPPAIDESTRAYAEKVWMPTSTFLIQSERSRGMSPQAVVNLFWRWYRHVGFDGCSSHSGRRTFITNTARKISTVGGSLRDVQMLAGHTNLRTTQRYIEPNAEAQVRVVGLV